MKKVIYVILIFAVFTSCQTTSSDNIKEYNSEKIDSLEKKVEHKKSTVGYKQEDNSIFIKDSSDYSISFLEKIKELGMHNTSLVDSFMIFDKRDTVRFPEIPRIGKSTILTAKKDELVIALTTERVNQTSIKYKIEMVEFGKSSYEQKGYADLNPRFYLGSEVDESSLSGLAYLSTEFIIREDSCYTFIRLGREEESGPMLLGKLIKNCNWEIQDIDHDNFPTLVEK